MPMDKSYIHIVPAHKEETLFSCIFCNILSCLPIVGLKNTTYAKFNSFHNALACNFFNIIINLANHKLNLIDSVILVLRETRELH